MSHLPDQFLVNRFVSVWSIESLLQEGKQDGDDDDGLQGLSEDNQEYWHSKDVDCHG